MTRMAYRARTIGGETVEGRTAAGDERELRLKLSEKGLELLASQEIPGKRARARKEPAGAKWALPQVGFFKPVKSSQLRAMTSQLALMLETGTPLAESLGALAEQMEGEALGDVLTEVHGTVSGGSNLSEALGLHPRVFGTFYVSAVRAGETAGNLTEVFKRLETDMAKREDLVSRLRAALTYPAILTLIATGAVVFLVSFVLPKFALIFQNAGARLPLPTRILLGVTATFQSYWYLCIAAVLAPPVAAWFFFRTPDGKRILDNLLLRLPVVGSLVKTVQCSVLLRTLSTLLGSGVPLMESLEVAERGCSNTRFKETVSDIASGVLRGEGFSSNFSRSDLFSPSIKQMVATGERTGRMALVMGKLSEYQDEMAQKQVQRLSALFEPMIIVVMGGIIGFIAISLMLPLFRMSSVISRGG